MGFDSVDRPQITPCARDNTLRPHLYNPILTLVEFSFVVLRDWQPSRSEKIKRSKTIAPVRANSTLFTAFVRHLALKAMCIVLGSYNFFCQSRLLSYACIEHLK